MSRHRADANLSAILVDVREVFDATDVNQQCGLRESQLHRWDEAVAAREYLRVVLMLSEQTDSFVKSCWRDVIEWCWNHFCILRENCRGRACPCRSRLIRTRARSEEHTSELQSRLHLV